ncbi:MAG: T9SS type A sorting domain-containing protein [Saprospiraceae bacterium]|nr:T9SS type A sorting domain-containing protein [Saprospiraceae bacterium]
MLFKRTSIVLLFIAFVMFLQAQSHELVCGTLKEDLEQITLRLLQNKADLSQNPLQPRSMQYIPIKFHIVSQDDGSGMIHFRYILDQLCALNEDFAEMRIQFYMKDNCNYVRDNRINEDHYHYGYLMESDRDTSAINIWIVKTPYSPNPNAITPGLYQTSKDWLVMNKTFVNNNSFALSHEIGHFFGLLHTFNGWDTDPWKADKHGNPAPASSPLNIPTEMANGLNCRHAGDYICDTPPDYNFGFYWTTDCNYTGGARDPMGNLVNPDESNFMSYFDQCARDDYHFSSEQKYLIETDLMTNSRAYIRTGFAPLFTKIEGTVELKSPSAGTQVPYYNAVPLEWSAVAGANRYLIEIDRVPNFTLQPQSFLTADTSFTVEVLDPNRTYYWRIRPFNEYYACASTTASKLFKTGNLATATQNISQLRDWNISPNPIPRNTSAKISFNTLEGFEADLTLYNTTGQIVQHIGKQRFTPGLNTLQLTPEHLNAGIYFLRLQTNKGRLVEKIIVY